MTRKESGERDFSVSVPVGDFYWYFQAFNIKNKSTTKREVSPFLRRYTQEGSIRHFLAERPLKEGSGKEVQQASLTTFDENPSIVRRVRLKTPKEIVKQLSNNGFGDVLKTLNLDYSDLEG